MDIVEAGARIAAGGARQYLDRHGLEADGGALATCLTSHVRAAFPAALADVREALNAGMGKWAEQTFRASMVLAGIEAAKEAGEPAQGVRPC